MNLMDKTKKFIEKVKKVHSTRYDYTEVNYINAKTKIRIKCNVNNHGTYEQNPSSHLNGNGCPICGKERVRIKNICTTKKFIEKAQKIHGKKYDYTKVMYVNNVSIIIIICAIHGEFSKTPKKHLAGQGCQQCSKISASKKLNMGAEKFIKKAKEIHGDKYDYSMVNYIDGLTNVILICTIHGEFNKKPRKHLAWQGCQKCSQKKISYLHKRSQKFIKRAIKIHKGKYNYKMSNYTTAHNKISIICPKHGIFTQTPDSHLRCGGCPKCAKKNYSKISIKWLTEMMIKNTVFIQHAENIGEYMIPELKQFVDGYCKETNTVYEFNGDLFHGNENLYNLNDKHPLNGKTFGNLYYKTLYKEEMLRNFGYNLIIMWEEDYRNELKKRKNKKIIVY